MNKLKEACGSDIVTFEDLVDIKCGEESEIMKAFMSSDIKIFKNDYNKCIQFLGTFLFVCSFGHSASDTLKENSIVNKKLSSDVKHQLMSYNNCVSTWNQIAKSGLKKACMPNYEIITSPGIIPFWETIQGAINSHCRNLHLRGWDINNKMSAVIDDDKRHLNCKIATDYYYRG